MDEKGQPIRGVHKFQNIAQRIQGIEALIRGSLMGIRVDYPARIIAAPTNNTMIK